MILCEQPRIELILGDCLKVMKDMPDKSIDLVLTDPPYGVEGGHGGQLKDYRKADYTSFNDNPEYIKTVCVPAINECLKISKTVVLTPGTRCSHSYPQPDEIGGFYQPASNRIGKFGFQNLQPIFFYGYYKNRGRGALHTVYKLCESAEKNGHPCPKPIKAWKWLLDRTSETGDLVLDPFMGSGTTAIACWDLNRNFVGIEIDEKYFNLAVARFQNHIKQQKLF